MTLPQTLKVLDIGLRSDSKSSRRQDHGSYRDPRCSRRMTLTAVPAVEHRRLDLVPSADVLKEMIEALRQGDQLVEVEIAAPGLPQLFHHLRKPGPASIA